MADLPVPEPPHPRLDKLASERIADADRDRTVGILREHVVAGRLTLDEFSERMGAALEARTRGDLDAVMQDLPAGPVGSGQAARPARRWHVAVMSGHSTRGRWRLAARTRAIAVMGGCTMDLRRAEIEGPDVEISATAFWGGIEIIVPEGFEVDLRGFSFMGGRSVKLRDVAAVPGSPRILVNAVAIMGGIEVKSRPVRGDRALERRSRKVRKDRSADRVGRQTDVRPGISGPPSSVNAGDGTVTILFCDMVDYSGMTERIGDGASHRVLRDFQAIVRNALSRHGGREIKVHGDGFMVAFTGAARSLRCALDLQRACQAYVPTQGGEPIAAHVGIHTGDAVTEDDDFLGHTVIVASRLADVAGPGEILVSSLSRQLVQGSAEFSFAENRDIPLKGLERPQPAALLLWTE